MMENAVATGLWITIAGLAVSLFTLTILVLIFLILYELRLRVASAPPANSPAIASGSGAAALVAAKKAAASLKPGRSCGHCGTRIKGDPIRGIAFDDKNYIVLCCPDCKKETLLPE
jgi:hypothetical protein